MHPLGEFAGTDGPADSVTPDRSDPRPTRLAERGALREYGARVGEARFERPRADAKVNSIMHAFIEHPDSPALASLCEELAEAAPSLEEDVSWPGEQLAWCAEAGVFRWFHTPADGGLGWSEADLCRGYVALGQACLTTAFVITQRVGAARRIAGATTGSAKERLLAPLLRGEIFATVGISHLTTSRQHLQRPVLRAIAEGGGYRLEGMSPWVTGAPKADWLVVGAVTEDGQQILAAVPTDQPGVETPPGVRLVALTASQTGPVHFYNVFVPADDVLAGPADDVMGRGKGASTGGLQTSALAVGLAGAAVGYLEKEAAKRPNLRTPADALRDQWEETHDRLLALASREADAQEKGSLRQEANSLVLRATQAALGAAKGAGYVWSHPAGRWCREALFFLVWSCPQQVTDANLCELAQSHEV